MNIIEYYADGLGHSYYCPKCNPFRAAPLHGKWWAEPGVCDECGTERKDLGTPMLTVLDFSEDKLEAVKT